MNTNELTPGQKALLDYCSPLDAEMLHRDLSTTLGESMARFTRREGDLPSPATIAGWYNTLHLIGHLHALSVEGAKQD